jgi:hypothetical protein
MIALPAGVLVWFAAGLTDMRKGWKMRDFTLFDPCGFLWRVAQDID